MKKIVIVLAAFVVLGLLFWAGEAVSKRVPVPDSNRASVMSALIASETFFDFGTISMKDGKVSRMFTVKNANERPVTIRKVTTSCMCTEAFIVRGAERRGPFGMPGHSGFVPPAKEVVPAGETLGIEVIFDPAAHGPAGVGRIERAIFVEDEQGGVQTITIKALVTP